MNKKIIINKDEAPVSGTSIKQRVIEQYRETEKNLKNIKDKSEREFQEYAIKKQLELIDQGKIPSLENALTDGIQYESRASMEGNIALRSFDGYITGEKTAVAQFGEDGLIVKGYSALDREVAQYIPAEYDGAIGISAAKDYSQKVTPLDISGSGKEWYKALRNVDPEKNVIEVDMRNINLAHAGKSPEGVLLSSSMQDYEPPIYKQIMRRSDVSDITNTLSTVEITNSFKKNSRELLPWLKQLDRDEGFTQTQGDRGTVTELIEFGANYENPLIRDVANRSVRDKLNNVMGTDVSHYGKDGTLIPDSKSEYKSPELVELSNTAFRKGDIHPNEATMRVNKTFGEMGIAAEDLNIFLPSQNSKLNFAINYKGVDIILNPSKGTENIKDIPLVRVNEGKWRAYSPLVEFISDPKSLHKHFVGENAPKVPDYLKSNKIYSEASKSVEKVINKILRYKKLYNDYMTYLDVVNLLEGGTIELGKNQIKVSLSPKELDIVKKHNISLGGTGIAIPLKIYDKAFQRIVKPHSNKGLIKLNHYDERVIHQRDNDGDKFFWYAGLPASINAFHARKQGYFRDFYTYKKDNANINIYGHRLDGNNYEAGRGNVGISQYLDGIEGK